MIDSSLPQSEPVLVPGRPFGRQVRSVLGYSLLTTLMIVIGIPVFIPAVLLHCAIRIGRVAAWATLVLSLGLASLQTATARATTPSAHEMAWWFLAGVLLTLALPSMTAVSAVERGEKFGRVLVLLLAGATAGLVLTEIASTLLFQVSPHATLVSMWKEMGARAVQFYRANKMPAEMIRNVEMWNRVSAYIVPAWVMMFIAVSYGLSLLMLGRLSALRPLTERAGVTEALSRFRFRDFALPDWFLFAFIFGGLTPLASGLLQKVAANTLAVVVFLYFIQGLAIFRSLLITVGAGPGGTLIATMTLLFLFSTGVSQMLLIGAGLFDSFFDFRHFKKRKDDSHESHSD